jgi:outer membrane receptor protein involved in Fe transport
VTRVSIRGSGILSEDEPVGVQLLLDGLTLNQADGEAILEDFDLATIKYAEVFRGANAFKYGSLTRSRLWPQPHRRRAATLLMKRDCST